MSHQRTLCIDLDGTILAYENWRGADHFGEVVAGAREALLAFRADGWRIIIFTTRGDTKKVRDYLARQQVPFDYINENPDQPDSANPGKPIADIYIDDRAVPFRGDWTATQAAVTSFRLWYKDGNSNDTSPF